MFTHELFEVYDFENIPANRDIYVVSDEFMAQYEANMLRFFEDAQYERVGFVDPIAVRKIHANTLEASWYPNVIDRFHEIAITLPRSAFITCVESRDSDERPRIFAKKEWVENLHLRYYSVFGLVDAIGVKEALRNDRISQSALVALRSAIDELSARYADIAFLSFADSLLLKSNWKPGRLLNNAAYSPEIFLRVISEVRVLYKALLGLDVYAVLTQGTNEYYEGSLIHLSESKNHICLNSLGIPFAELLAIDESVRLSIKKAIHPPADLYLDSLYFHSLKIAHKMKGQAADFPYTSKLSATPSRYYCSSLDVLLQNLEEERLSHKQVGLEFLTSGTTS